MFCRPLALLLVVLAAAACSSIFPQTSVDERNQAPTPSRERLESFIGGALPASAASIYSAEEGFQDTIMWLRFDAPPQDIPAFLQSVGVEEALETSTDPSNLTPSEADWWQPQIATQGAHARYSTGTSTSCSVFVDQSRAEFWRVYLVCFNT